MLAERLDKLHLQVGRQERELTFLREESEALRAHLAAEGCLHPGRFSAELHRRRFVETLREHPLGPPAADAGGAVALLAHTRRVALATASFAGAVAARRLAAAQRAIQSALTPVVLREALALHPPELLVIGGLRDTLALASTERLTPAAVVAAEPSAAVPAGAVRWRPAPRLEVRRYAAAAAAVGQRVYVLGGFSGTEVLSSVECLDLEEDSWRSVSSMKGPRCGHAAAELNDKIFACGGWDGQQCLDTVERFDPERGLWETLPPMSLPRQALAAASLGGALYAVGGFDAPRSAALSLLERYDPRTSRPEVLAPMSSRRANPAAATLAGRLYAVGGFDGEAHLRTVEAFDPRAGRWVFAAPLSAARGGVAAGASGGRLYALGGYDGEACLSVVECYDPGGDGGGQWELLAPLEVARTAATVAAVVV